MRFVVWLLVVGAMLACACSSGAKPSTATVPTSPAGLETTAVRAGGRTIPAEVADTDTLRALGLSFRDSLADDAGMLFVFPQDVTPGFWMKEMRFPLDMVWIDAGKRVVGVADHVEPQPGAPDSALTLYRPPSPVRYVLELNAGAAARLRLAPGTQLSFTLSPTTTAR